MSAKFVFCPRCGAVTTPGICSNCSCDIDSYNYNLEMEKYNREQYGVFADEMTSKGSEETFTENTDFTDVNETSKSVFEESVFENDNKLNSFEEDNSLVNEIKNENLEEEIKPEIVQENTENVLNTTVEDNVPSGNDFGSEEISKEQDELTSDNYVNQIEHEIPTEPRPMIQPKEKKSKWWIWLLAGIGALGVLVLLLLGGGILLTTALFKSVKVNQPQVTVNTNTMNQYGQSTTPDDDDDDDANGDDDDDIEWDADNSEDSKGFGYYDTITGNEAAGFDFDLSDLEDYIANANEYTDTVVEEGNDFFSSSSYYPQNGESHEFIPRDQFETPYYDYVVNSFVNNDNYTVERHVIRYEGKENNVFVNNYSAYYQIYSEDVDFTAINEILYKRAVKDLYFYLDRESANTTAYNHLIYCDSFITFNNDEIMSIVYDYYSYDDNTTDGFYEYGVNIDMKNGEIMDNTQILNLDAEFAEFFKDRSDKQNGFVSALEYSTFDEISDCLNNPNALIIFFTPVGIEVGFNYFYTNYYGWVTVSINDYDDYLYGRYSFDTSYSDGYDVFLYEEENGVHYNSDEYDTDYDDLLDPYEDLLSPNTSSNL